jgi:hypothetical protein
MTVLNSSIPLRDQWCCLALLSCMAGTLALHLPQSSALQDRAFDLQRVRHTKYAGQGSQVLSAGPSFVDENDISPIFSGGTRFLSVPRHTEIVRSEFVAVAPSAPVQDLANDLRQIASGLTAREVAALIGVSHTAFYGWLRGEPIAVERQETIQNLTRALADIRSYTGASDLRKVLDARTPLGVTAADLLKAGEYDAALGAIFMIPYESNTVAPFGVGIELPLAASVPPWEGASLSPMSESPAVFEAAEASYFELNDEETVVLSAISVG